MNKKFDHIISAALRDTKANDSYISKFNHFSLTFSFLTPKERYAHPYCVTHKTNPHIHLL